MKLRISIVISLLFASVSSAQMGDRSGLLNVGVEVSLQGTNYDVSTYDESDPDITLGTTDGDGVSIDDSLNLAIIPGRIYNISVDSGQGSQSNSGLQNMTVNFKAPPGYTIYVATAVNSDPSKRSPELTGTVTNLSTTGPNNYDFKYMVVDDRTLQPALAGRLSRVDVADLALEWGLGTLENGKSAGRVQLRHNGYDGSNLGLPSALFKPGALDLVAPFGSGLTKTPITGGWELETGQIKVKAYQANPSVDSYTLEFFYYSGSSYSTTAFATYTLKRIGTTQVMEITEVQGSVTIKREITRSTTADDWILVEGTGTPRRIQKHSSTESGGIRTEQISIENAGGTKSARSTLKWSGTRLTEEKVWTDPTSAGAADLTTTYTYYADNVTGEGDRNLLHTISYPNGTSTTYDYYDDADRLGQIETVTEQWSTPGGSSTKVTTYDYDGPSNGYKDYLKSRVVKIGTTEIERVENDYGSTLGTSEVTFTTKNYHNASSHLETVTVAHPRDADYFLSDRPLSVEYPDGRQQSFKYDRGTWNGTAFTVDSNGTASRTIIIEGSHTASGTGVSSATIGADTALTFKAIKLLDKKSTATVIIRNATDNIVKETTYVWSGSSFATANKVAETTNAWHDSVRQSSATALNGAAQNWTWEGAYLKTRTDAAGVVSTYTYDDAGRTKTMNRAGVTNTYNYFPTNQRSSMVESGGSLTRTTSYTYDGLGRPTGSDLPDGRDISADYTLNTPSTGWLKTDETLSCGGHVITYTMPDGKVRNIDSTGVDEFYSYTVSSNGITTKIRYGADNDTRYMETARDRLGRVLTVTRPGLPGIGGTVTETYTYDGTTGLLTKIERTGLAAEYREYDDMGRLDRTGINLGGGSGLDPADSAALADRVTDIITQFVNTGGQWWASTERKTYPYNNGTALSLGTMRQQLTGLTGGASQTEEEDRFGQKRITSVAINTTNKTVTTTQSIPGVTNTVQTVTTNGRLTYTKDSSGRSVTYGYDGVGRRATANDSRNGTTHYEYYKIDNYDTDRLHKIKDPSGIYVGIYTYDNGGRVTGVQTPTGTSLSSYDCAGRLEAQWGAATPTSYGYNIYGERDEMRTFRNDDYATVQPPSSGGDLTTWSYDPGTGVLTQKKDAENETTDYTYYNNGLIKTITQARFAVGSSGPRATTTFTYITGSTEIDTQTFNDGGVTTTLDYDYDRSGLIKEIDDATGTRTFAYDSNLQLDTETLDATFYGGRKLVREYDTQHRPIGFTLQTSGSATELKQTHAYNGTTGLVETVSVQQGTASPRVFDYDYVPGTALLDKVETGSGGTLFSLDRDYESGNQRDLVSSIAASYGSGSAITDFDYTYRDDRRRATARQSGTASADYGDGSANSESIYYRYQYNFRGELIEAVGYLGTDVSQTTTSLSGRFHEYDYDGAGNRTTSNPTGDDTTQDPNDSQNLLYETSYTVNALNQIVEKENPFLSVSGTVQSAASGVSVDGLPAGKQGGHWSGEAFLSNDGATQPVTDTIPIKAIKAGTPDIGEGDSITQVIAPDPETIHYDLDGNLIEDGLWDYTYNLRNQLIKMETKIPTSSSLERLRLEFVYDYLGRRVEKKVTDLDTSAVTTRRYVYDGWNLVSEYAVSSGTIGALQRSYAWGLDIAGTLGQTGGVGALLQMSVHSSGVTDYYPTYDANGNVTALVESNGTLAAAYEYDPYGQMIRAEEIDSAVADNPFRFSTKFTDVESGLIYYGHRYYSSSLGRFINRDPIGEQGGLNLYAFVGNDPINSIDVLGLNEDYDTLCYEDRKGRFVCTPIDIVNPYGEGGSPPDPGDVGGGGGVSPPPVAPPPIKPPRVETPVDCQRLENFIDAVKDLYSNFFGNKAPLNDINDFFERNPDNSYASKPNRSATSLADPRSGLEWQIISFKEPFLTTVGQGLQYSVIRGVASSGGGGIPASLDGTYASSPRTPAYVERTTAALDAASGLISGQLDSQLNLSEFAFVYDDSISEWFIKDVSASVGGNYLEEGQGRTILEGIFESYDKALSKYASECE